MNNHYNEDSLFNPNKVPFRNHYIKVHSTDHLFYKNGFITNQSESEQFFVEVMQELFNKYHEDLQSVNEYELSVLNNLFTVVEGGELRVTLISRGADESLKQWAETTGEAFKKNVLSDSPITLGYTVTELFQIVTAFELFIQVCETFPKLRMNGSFIGFDLEDNSVEEFFVEDRKLMNQIRESSRISQEAENFIIDE